ncbi:transglutaminase-like cysteine peptidase [Caulobacter sp. 602-1]|uniref:transglutaminase-like cysteine peptidase n=1 Tax=Caulobacter sp. 602-1 TaxID=2492472 RepID=UPI000F6409AB|nr:transglutaminase-like cysteine peptidase [Caulobacter sp. 602-1]RRN64734.1 cysteine protease [Caulobacter sp. 602-1]
MFKARNIVLGLVSAIAMMAGASAQAGSMPFMPRGEGVGAPMGFADLCRRDADACGAPADQLAFLGGAVSLTATSSVGAPSQHHFEAVAPTASAVEDGANLIAVEVIKAWTPAAVEDFVAAGQLRPSAVAVAAAPAAAATKSDNLAWTTRTDREQVKLLNQVNQLVNRTVKKATDLELYGQPEYWSLPRQVNGKLYGDCEDYALEKRRQLIAAGVPETALSMAVAFTARGESHAVLMVSLESGDWVLDNLTPWATPWEDLNYRWVERQIPGTALWTTIA